MSNNTSFINIGKTCIDMNKVYYFRKVTFNERPAIKFIFKTEKINIRYDSKEERNYAFDYLWYHYGNVNADVYVDDNRHAWAPEPAPVAEPEVDENTELDHKETKPNSNAGIPIT